MLKKTNPLYIAARWIYRRTFRFWKQTLEAVFVYDSIKRGYKVKDDKKTINIVFLVCRANVWNSVRSVYEAAKEREYVNTYIIALPPLKNGQIDFKDETTYEFCREIDECAIKAYDSETGTCFDIKEIDPDYIFLNIPYEGEYIENYKFKDLSRVAKLCYIPYAYTMIKSNIQNIECTDGLVKYVSYIFAESNATYDYIRKRLWLSQLLSGKRLYNIGFPRFDLYHTENHSINKDHLTVMWLPRWTTYAEVKENGNEPSSFFENKDKILDYAADNKEDEIIIRPHPLTFETYVKRNMMTVQQIDEYKSRIDALPNVELDLSAQYYEGLIRADVLIADFSTLVAEFFVTGKPIIYFGSCKNYTAEHMKMYNSFYHADTWTKAEDWLNSLKMGIDPKKAQRQLAVSSFMNERSNNIGERIINEILNN